jgi:hypothetical protein
MESSDRSMPSRYAKNRHNVCLEEISMNGAVFTYIGSLLLIGWGIAHLFPTRAVVRGFGEITPDNKRTITMEWITEGVALIFIGLLVAAVTFLDRTDLISRAVYWASFAVLNVLSVVSLFTGFRNAFIAFKLCPFIFTGSSLLIIVGAFLN